MLAGWMPREIGVANVASAVSKMVKIHTAVVRIRSMLPLFAAVMATQLLAQVVNDEIVRGGRQRTARSIEVLPRCGYYSGTEG